MGEGCQGRRPNATHHLASSGVASEIGAKNDRVDQRADELSVPGRLRLATFVATRTSSWPRVAMQQRLQGRDQRHEQRATFFMAEAFGGFHKARRQRPRSPHGAEIIGGPSWSRLRKLHDGQRIAKLPSPVFELRNDLRV